MNWQPLNIVSLSNYARFVADFQACTLPRPCWTHHAHLAVALWYLDRWPPHEALVRVRRDIRAYNESVGVANTDTTGYHETLTQLFMRGVLAHKRAAPVAPLPELLGTLLASPLTRSDWPLQFYSKQRLFSVAARHDWITPDLTQAPLPWSGADDAAFTINEEFA
jgi:hypothetical protein